MPKLLLTIIISCSCIFNNIYGQQVETKATGSTQINRRIGVFINLVSPIEVAYGAGISYRLSPKWHISAELSYLAGDHLAGKGQGFRMTFTIKRFFLKDLLFYGMDARVKFLSYTDVQDFVNPRIPDTLFRYSHHVNKTVYAGGFIFGVKAPFPKTKRIALQVNVGVGLKYRNLNRTNVPSGYKYHDTFYPKREWFTLNYTGSQESGFNIYLPAGIRFFYYFS